MESIYTVAVWATSRASNIGQIVVGPHRAQKEDKIALLIYQMPQVVLRW